MPASLNRGTVAIASALAVFAGCAEDSSESDPTGVSVIHKPVVVARAYLGEDVIEIEGTIIGVPMPVISSVFINNSNAEWVDQIWDLDGSWFAADKNGGAVEGDNLVRIVTDRGIGEAGISAPGPVAITSPGNIAEAAGGTLTVQWIGNAQFYWVQLLVYDSADIRMFDTLVTDTTLVFSNASLRTASEIEISIIGANGAAAYPNQTANMTGGLTGYLYTSGSGSSEQIRLTATQQKREVCPVDIHAVMFDKLVRRFKKST